MFQLLKKTNKKWDDVAEDILFIESKDKRDEIRNRFSTDDDRLRESIIFWLKRCPFASYRWLAFKDVSTDIVEPIPGERLINRYSPFSLLCLNLLQILCACVEICNLPL